MANLGPSNTATVNTESPRSTHQTIQTIAVTMTPASVATVTAPEQSFGLNGATFVTAATGILAGDVILNVSPPSVTAGVGIAGARVDTTTNDKFYVQFVNPTAGPLVPPSGVWLITVARYIQSVSTTPGTLSSLPTSVALS
jgi:hypothetical protein